jgi:hypothetical protein
MPLEMIRSKIPNHNFPPQITALQSKQRGLTDEIHLQKRKLGGGQGFILAFAKSMEEIESLRRSNPKKAKDLFNALYKKYQNLDPAGERMVMISSTSKLRHWFQMSHACSFSLWIIRLPIK